MKVLLSSSSADIERARAVCQSYPVQAACVQYAHADDALASVRAGTTEREQREMRRGGVA